MRTQAIILLAALLVPLAVFAQTDRSYHYTNITAVVDVRTDTTVVVEEKQTYSFVGEYHLGYRSISHKGIDAITDVSVVDTATGKALRYSYKKLSKDNPENWGAYTVSESGGATNIEWYYDLASTPNPSAHTWIIRYTVHGALAFYKDHDELYWNVFTDYDVPVDVVEATVRLPGVVTVPQSSFYTTNKGAYVANMPTPETFYFSTTNIAPKESVTFAVGWQKGLVDQSAYWLDFCVTHWGLVFGALLLFLTIVGCVLYWVVQERRNRGRGTIIAQYEPPQSLPPAIADLIVHGQVSPKAWAATVVDLAVRGHVTIAEDTRKDWLERGVLVGIGVGMTAIVFYVTFIIGPANTFATVGTLLFPVLLVVLWFSVSKRSSGFGKNYMVERRVGGEDSKIAPYEQEFLESMFALGPVLSTRDLFRSRSKRRKMYSSLQEVEKSLDTEAVSKTGAFAVLPRKTIGAWGFLVLFVSMCIVVAVQLFGFASFIILAIFALFSALVVVMTTQRTRLNKKGHILKEEWLGFKLYLQTAERYRLQNLTPETFEKYLPYAMIFGVEKQWAKTFETMALPPPSWYSAPDAYASSGTFSPVAFASGFSASFTSSFVSSGSGGASGGGGSAGGGGGGGGGGAS